MLGWELQRPFGMGGELNHAQALMLSQNLNLPVKAMAQPHVGATTQVWYNNKLDLLPPGVRDNVANPTFFGSTKHRTNLYDAQHTNNNAPMPNWDLFTDSITSQQQQRLGSYWWDICHSQFTQAPGFVERGQFNVPSTGFTGLRFLTPHSTLAWN